MTRVRFPLPAPVPGRLSAWLSFVLSLVLLATAGFAQAAPLVVIHGAAARVAVIPQAGRRDVAVMVLQTNRDLPIRVRRQGGRMVISGGLARQVHACGGSSAPGGVAIRGRGVFPMAALPRLVIYTPPEVRLLVGDAVFGVIGRSASVEMDRFGCGDWVIADTRGRLHVDQAGAGETRAGRAGSADLAVAGSGRIAVRAVAHGLTAISSGSGVLEVGALAGGPADLRIAGAGSVRIDSGAASALSVSTAGSGGVRAAITARSLTASVTGSGDVRVKAVTGPVARRTFGAGQVLIGP
ncbi:MAG: hypothetical protein KGL69_08245 [Alphaproteobacteria bacterium]|nr:hypothetical protein [Alphaproteobacteria bacterium]